MPVPCLFTRAPAATAASAFPLKSSVQMIETVKQRRASYDALTDAYARLPAATRAQLNAAFKAERSRGAALSWGQYLAVVLPLLPPDAR